jgi:pre-mRNA-processing factor 6
MYRNLIAPDFMQRQAPSNYIAGLGRGASGFTTRGDIGGAREQVPDQPDDIQAQIQKQLQMQQQVKEDEDMRFQDPDTESGLFANLNYGILETNFFNNIRGR